jgi:xanthine dehydrogenase iron-sulfur cluster and FAD-binding subunit A
VLPWDQFITGPKRNTRRPDELIVGVRLPEHLPARSAFAKVGVRNAMVIAIASCCLTRDEDGSTRVALGSVGPTPVRARQAEEMISAGSSSESARAEFARLSPPRCPDHRSPLHRRVPAACLGVIARAPWSGCCRDSLHRQRSHTYRRAGGSGKPSHHPAGRARPSRRQEPCEQGECGSCTVIMDGELVCSCLVLAATPAAPRSAPSKGRHRGRIDAVQEALLGAGGVQCGFCTPGIVVAADHLFARTPIHRGRDP